jgi:hypothetical protein
MKEEEYEGQASPPEQNLLGVMPITRRNVVVK